MNFLLNSPRHDVLFDFSADGEVLYYFRGWKPDQGQIFVDTFRQAEQRTLNSDPFTGPAVANLGDGTLFVVGDTLILFSSRRPGGYGGLDLYRTALRNGQWTAPKNLGPEVNSAYDETTPFLARDGFTMYYSTNHPDLSIGGLDIVKVVYNPNSRKWTQPELLPPPLNSAGDDAYFRLAKDGFTAYFSSSRKDGYGKRDIYAAYFNEFLPEMELPTSYANLPVGATQKVQPDLSPPAMDLAADPEAADDIQATEPVRVEEKIETPSIPTEHTVFLPLSFEANYSSLKEYQEQALNRAVSVLHENPDLGVVISAYGQETARVGQQLFTAIGRAELVAEYITGKGISGERLLLRASLADQGQKPAGQRVDLAFFGPEKVPAELPTLGRSSSSFAVPQHALNKALLYKVQIGALKGVYNSSRIAAYDTPMAETTIEFPYYRYTVGAFETYEEAEAFRQELLRGPFDSALVVAYVYGRRANHKLARQYLGEFADLKHYID